MGGRLTVRYFAAAAAAAGTEVEDIEVIGPVDREVLFERLSALHPTPPAGEPPLGTVLARSTCLVEGRRLAEGRTVDAGETVDVLPPFSGG